MFRAEVGVPIHRYRKLVRVSRAMEQLRKGICPSEVAAAVGFCDQSHMTRAFRQLIGVAPGAYAKWFEPSLGNGHRRLSPGITNAPREL